MNTARSGPVGVAVVGAGIISDEYLRNLTCFPDVSVLVVSDVVEERARLQADKYGVADFGGIRAALDNPDVEIVINLTVPAAHGEVSAAALEAGKNAYTEKPFALDRRSGWELLQLATDRGLRLGAAPDTFLGPGLQSAQRVIARGDIGEPVSALTMMQDPGPESWHTNPAFLYANGAGPLWDRGPYYLAMLTQLFGPMRSVAAMATKAFTIRTIGAGPNAGSTFPVDIPTNVAVVTSFDDGRIAQSTYSYESALPRPSFIEISGTEATLAVPDPNCFDGDLYIYPMRRDVEEIGPMQPGEIDRTGWTRIPVGGGPWGRGIGVLDLARAIRAGGQHRASAELGFHVLDTLSSIEESIDTRTVVDIESTVTAADSLSADWMPTQATL